MREREINRRDFLKLTGAGGAGVVLVSLAGPAVESLLKASKAEASAIPEDLPPYMTYFEEAAVEYSGASRPSVVLRRKGDILLLMSQRINVMGNLFDIDAANHPDMTQVIAIANEGDGPVSIGYETFEGVYARQDRERTPRTDRGSLIDDALTANLVQVSRTRIPGNCVSAGCAGTRIVTALAFDQNGTPIFELLENRVDFK